MGGTCLSLRRVLQLQCVSHKGCWSFSLDEQQGWLGLNGLSLRRVMVWRKVITDIEMHPSGGRTENHESLSNRITLFRPVYFVVLQWASWGCDYWLPVKKFSNQDNCQLRSWETIGWIMSIVLQSIILSSWLISQFPLQNQTDQYSW